MAKAATQLASTVLREGRERAGDLPVMLTVDEVASVLQTSAYTVRRMVAGGQLAAIRLRGRRSSLRVPLQEVWKLVTTEEET